MKTDVDTATHHVPMTARAMLTVVSVVTLLSLLGPQAALATGCNVVGCWSATVEVIQIDAAGRIFFVVDNSDRLQNLEPADGCQVKLIWTGQAESALFVSTDDPEREEKLKLLLVAQTSGQTVGFKPVRDAATGWCRLDSLGLGAT